MSQGFSPSEYSLWSSAEKRSSTRSEVINLKDGRGRSNFPNLDGRGHQQCDYQLQSLSLGHSHSREEQGMEGEMRGTQGK